MNRKKIIAQKAARQQEILDAAKRDKRSLTDGEKEEFDALQRDIEGLMREEEDGENSASGGEGQERSQAGGLEREITQERTRAAEINAICREFGMEDEAGGFIRSGQTLDKVREKVIEKLRKENAPAEVRIGDDEQDKFRDAASDALLMRGGIRLDNSAAGAEELRGMSLRDLAVECLCSGGRKEWRRSADELFSDMQRQFLNPSAAFPAIMDSTINKAYVQGHKTAPVTFDRWTKKGTLKDFKAHDNNYLSGPAGEFLEVPEGGELKHDTWRDEKRPTRKLKTYGRQFTLTRQAFINDDIEAIVKMPAKYAAAARKTQNKQCYQKLVDNPAAYDGIRIFDKKHANLLAKGTGITQAAVQGMIMALSGQRDEFGEACIIRPAYIIVPSGYQFDVYTLFNSPSIHTGGNTQAVNPLYGYRDSIQVIEDPTINVLCGGAGNQMPWWLVGAQEDTDFIEVDYLNGQEVPAFRRAEASGALGYVWDTYLDWTVEVMDYRGAVKNPGETMQSPVELA